MATVSWGGPDLEFIKVPAGGAAPSGDWSSKDGYVKIPGSVLLENSSQLNTTEGDTKEVKNELGEVVDSKRLPASYEFTTSVIKKKGETVVKTAFSPKNGIVAGDWMMRLVPEDPATTGFIFAKSSISVSKSWSPDQGALDVITVKGVKPDTESGEICEDYSQTS